MRPDDREAERTHRGELTRRAFLQRGAAFGLTAGALSIRVPSLLGSTASDALSPGVRGTVSGEEISLSNSSIEASWSVSGGVFRALRVRDRLNGGVLTRAANAFSLTLAGGEVVESRAMRIMAPPRMESLEADGRASRFVERLQGKQISVSLQDSAGRLRVDWRAVLRDGSSYMREELTIRSLGSELPVREIALIDLQLPGAELSGTVKGSPVVAGTMYMGFEHPLSESTVDGDHVRCGLSRELPLRAGTSLVCSSVIGVTRPGQLRRDFLTYVERERAHPYRTFLHYNSWYDIGYFSQFSESDALAAIAAFGSELGEKRNVVLSSFLFDDGWDDHASLWHFNADFPDGFTRVRQAAERYGAAPGVWLSPWGGYGKPKEERLAHGRALGFETNDGGFALSGPRYYRLFRDTCLEMIRKYGVNQFKFDGTGNAARSFPGSAFDSDFDAAISLIGELRAEEPELYVNLTTGTYPSPFWLRYADSIWRGGEDHDFAGTGSDRQQWITYRDADTYANVVRRGSLYPLNSLMLHGLIYARHARKLDTDPRHDFGAEVRSYFGSGTQLQEMYITPSLLGAGDWDAIAEAARWSRRNAATLRDTHWVGGDPAKLEAYGWASWSEERGILTLRNPSDRKQSLALDVARALELPGDAPRQYTALSPWRAEQGRDPFTLTAGQEYSFDLEPFEVLTLHTTPR